MAGYDPQTCFNNLVNANKLPCATINGQASYHCTPAQSQQGTAIYEYCHTHDIYLPFEWSMACPIGWDTGPIANRNYSQCFAFDKSSDLVKFLVKNPTYESVQCYCCCSCFAYDTPIMTPAGFQAIQKLAPGDEVTVAAVSMQGGKIVLEWAPKQVRVSGGVPPVEGSPTPMVLVHFGAGQHLLCTGDQIFLRTNGKLKRANQLTVMDKLVDPNGDPVDITAIKLVEYSGGVHHIATGRYRDTINGHLLMAGGVVVGDYSLQNGPIDDLMQAGPVIGTPEYDKLCTKHKAGVHSFAAVPANAAAHIIPVCVRLYTATGENIPTGAGTFFTGPQGVDILAKAKLRPFGDRSGIPDLNYVFAIYRTFFPDINFWLDWENPMPSAYAFTAFGQKTIVVSGQLLRIDGLFIQGYAAIVASCIGRFLKPEGISPGANGMLPTVQADYFGIGVGMRKAWFNGFYDMVKQGLAQIEMLFSYVSPENAKGNPLHPLEDPSLDCRKTTIMTAWLGGPLPLCAGGPPPVNDLRLIGCQIDNSSGNPVPVLYFDNPVDPTTAAVVANYTFKPAVKLTAAKALDDPTAVALTGNFAAGTAYMVQVANLKTQDGYPLDPESDVTRFVMPKA